MDLYKFVFCCSLLFILSPSIATQSFRPKSLVLPVSKDTKSLEYTTHIHQRTPLAPVKLTIDLGGRFLWVTCGNDYVSSTYKPAMKGSAQCSRAQATCCLVCGTIPDRMCKDDACVLTIHDGGLTDGVAQVGQDFLSMQSSDGKNHGKLISVPNFLFACGSSTLLLGHAKGIQGMAGLGRTDISLPSQLSSTFSFPKKFAICLSSSKGTILFGHEPGVDISKKLMFTPLVKNPISNYWIYATRLPSSEYFIKVKSIKINGNTVPLNASLLSSFDRDGRGGTKISTLHPYTVLETSIYRAFVKAFVKEVGSVARVKAVKPFEVCYNKKKIGSTITGPDVPNIDLVLQNNVYWRIFGANSMVQVKKNVLCLAFLEDMYPTTSIVIGGHQLEDILLQFDLARARVGFSSSLLLGRANCSNFNFTRNA